MPATGKRSGSESDGAWSLVPGPLLVIAAVLIGGFVGLQMPSAGQSSRESGPEAEAAAPAPPPSPQQEPEAHMPAEVLLQQFLGYQPQPPTSGTIDGHRLRCLIATIPDPIDSHLQTVSDNALLAIEQACATHGYGRDSYRLPWIDHVGKPVAEHSDTSPLYRRQPGAVLFRKPVPREINKSRMHADMLMLLLVGETPTDGIQKRALDAAVSFAAKWQTTDSQSDTLNLKMVGPCFSGSAASLRLGLSALNTAFWPDRFRRAKVLFQNTGGLAR